MGKLVRERIEGTMDASVAAKFSISRAMTANHRSRFGQAKALPVNADGLWEAEKFNENRKS